jgi:hypothetical protein
MATGAAEAARGVTAAARDDAPRVVLTVGLAPEDEHWLARIDAPQRFRYLPAGDPEISGDPERCEPRAFVEETVAAIRASPEPVAAIIAADDYPASLLAAAVAERTGLPGPGFAAMVCCAHKGWSRILQREVVPEAVPRFQLIDPYRDYAPGDFELPFPFWLKPVKSALSYLGFRVDSPADVARVQARARAELPRYARAFTEMLDLCDAPRPRELEGTTGEWLIAEALMSGRQCTLEGWCVGGEMSVLGIVDSVRMPNRVSFARFEYPSRLPRRAQDEMARIAARVMRHTGFDTGLFNIEFFVGADGRPKIIEINPRLCLQFTDLYEKVDGVLTHQLLVELASGLAPAPPRGRGRHRVAASFVLRTRSDCVIRRVPDPATIQRIAECYPGTLVHVLGRPGERLSDLAQDSYTFRYGLVQLGADSRRELKERYASVLGMLDFGLDPV